MEKYVDIKLGYTCNNNCVHCVIADQRRNALQLKGREDRTIKECKRELLDSRKRGFDNVIITGGEPTIREDLFEILEYTKKIGYKIHMQTNGRMFFNFEFARRLSKFGINYTIALHGSNSSIHDSITQVKGSFEQTVNGIKNLKKLNQAVNGKVVMSKLNCNNLDKLLKLFKNLNVKYVNFAFPHGLGNARINFDWVVPRYTEIKPYVHNLAKLSEKLGIEVNFEAMPYCFMEGIESYILEKRLAKYIELKQFGMKTNMWSEKRKYSKAKFTQCKRCKYDKCCEGVWIDYAEKNKIIEILT